MSKGRYEDEVRKKLIHQLSIEYNCNAKDFKSRKNIISESVVADGRRHYIEGSFFFQMATLGGNAVITADQRLHPFLKEFVTDKEGHWLFEYHNLRKIELECMKYEKILWQTHHMFLPHEEYKEIKLPYKTVWFEQNEISPFYTGGQYPNALCKEYNPLRPDTLAVCAYDGDMIIGMAGCSADTEEFWQIGIDVEEAYRGKGVGSGLVAMLKNEIIRRGKIPFYGTSLSNLYSWNIALNSGFYPAWVEVQTIE